MLGVVILITLSVLMPQVRYHQKINAMVQQIPLFIDQVIREGQLQLPLQLLQLKPKLLADKLSASLPVEQVQVSRLMLPPRRRITRLYYSRM